MEINERLQMIVDKLFNGNKAAFSKTINIKPTTISNIIGRDRKSKPSSEILENIIKCIPVISAEWLLSGEGSMLKEGSPNVSFNVGKQHIKGSGNRLVHAYNSTYHENAVANSDIEAVSEELNSVKKEKELLTKENIHLKEMLEERKKRIESLEQFVDFLQKK